MPTELWIAMLTLVGTLVGTFGGIVTSNKMTCYRIEQLENRVGEHNNFARRKPVAEKQIELIECRLDDLEHK